MPARATDAAAADGAAPCRSEVVEWTTAGWRSPHGRRRAAFCAAGPRRRRARAAALPPLAQFLHDLAALAAEPSPLHVHTGISLALRHLLAALAGFPAAERTTTEIDRELRRGPLEPATRRRLLDLLRRCDEVKFACRPATRQEAQERLAAARQTGEEMGQQLAPPPAEAIVESAA